MWFKWSADLHADFWNHVGSFCNLCNFCKLSSSTVLHHSKVTGVSCTNFDRYVWCFWTSQGAPNQRSASVNGVDLVSLWDSICSTDNNGFRGFAVWNNAWIDDRNSLSDWVYYIFSSLTESSGSLTRGLFISRLVNWSFYFHLKPFMHFFIPNRDLFIYLYGLKIMVPFPSHNVFVFIYDGMLSIICLVICSTTMQMLFF